MRVGFLILFFSIGLWACSSASELEEPTSYAHPAAATVEGFYLEAPAPPHQRPVVEGPFYFRACTRTNQGTYYSKTSFNCSDR